MSTVTKAIIPAAGMGKRMHPLSSYISKPMLPLKTKPILHHIVDEIKAAGIDDILIIARSEHKAMRDYFSDMANVTFLTDDSAGGPGEAILKGEEFAGDEPFLVVFSDAPLDGEQPENVILEMKEIFQKHPAGAVLSVYSVPKKEAGSRGIVRVQAKDAKNRLFQVEDIIEKPDNIDISHPKASACRYLFGPELFDALKAAERDEDGELQLTAGINELIKSGHVVLGVNLPEGITRHDTGNFEGYFRALNSFIPVEP